MVTKSMVKLRIIESKCPNCRLPVADFLHFWFHWFVGSYAILLLHNLIYQNFGLSLTITPSLILVTEDTHLKNLNVNAETKKIILNLILAYKNAIHLDFFTKKLYVSPYCKRYHRNLMKRIVKSAFKAFPQVVINNPPPPKFLPSGKKFPTLLETFNESRQENIYHIPRLIIWQSEEVKSSAISSEALILLSEKLTSLPTRLT